MIICDHLFTYAQNDIIQIYLIQMGQCKERAMVQDIGEINSRGKNNPNTQIPPIQQLRMFPFLPQTIEKTMIELGQFQFTNLPSSQLEYNGTEGDYQMFAKKQLQKNGIFKLRDKSIVQGTINQDGLVIGPAKLLFPGSAYILSTFKDGKPFYKTRIIRYSGQYFNGFISPGPELGQSHGQIYEKGVKYIGEVRENKPHGKGQEISDTHYFKGQYNHGKKVRGIMKLFCRNVRKNIKSDEIESLNRALEKSRRYIEKSKFHKKKYEKYEGQFQDGVYSGHGILLDITGRYQGQFVDGKRHGEGQQSYWDGKFKKGIFSHGQLIKQIS